MSKRRARLSNVHVHAAPPHFRPHHQANVKIVMLKFVLEVWLKSIETTTKKVIRFYGEKNVEAHLNSAHYAEIAPSITLIVQTNTQK